MLFVDLVVGKEGLVDDYHDIIGGGVACRLLVHQARRGAAVRRGKLEN